MRLFYFSALFFITILSPVVASSQDVFKGFSGTSCDNITLFDVQGDMGLEQIKRTLSSQGLAITEEKPKGHFLGIKKPSGSPNATGVTKENAVAIVTRVKAIPSRGHVAFTTSIVMPGMKRVNHKVWDKGYIWPAVENRFATLCGDMATISINGRVHHENHKGFQCKVGPTKVSIVYRKRDANGHIPCVYTFDAGYSSYSESHSVPH